jgi:transcriptional regulator with XRE-family HTH domain
MTAAGLLRHARRRAGLTQRQLAARSGVPQATIARIEAARSEPRFALLRRLLKECGQDLVSEDLRGQGIDRTVIRELLALTPGERLKLAADEARNLAAFEELVRWKHDAAREP